MQTNAMTFFIWLGALISSVCSISAVIALWFGLVDTIQTPYLDPSLGTLSAAALLIVSAPTLGYLLYTIHKLERADKAISETRIRSWVLYAVMTVSIVTILVDTYTLLSSFLQGEEITTVFIAKIAVVLLCMLFTMWYTRKEIGGYWSQNTKHAEVVGMSAGAFAAVTVVLVFLIVGTPMHMRRMMQDRTRVQSLVQIQYQVFEYWQRNQKLPERLEQLNNPNTGTVVPGTPADGITFTAKDSYTFELCANFAERYKQVDTTSPYGPNEFWDHEAGVSCFTRVVDPKQYPPVVMPMK